MNRSLLLIYLVCVPIVAYALLYVLGFTRLWSGFPFVWVLGCIPILSLGDGCGLVVDWTLFWLDVLLYTALGYLLLTSYWGLQRARKPHPASYKNQPTIVASQ